MAKSIKNTICSMRPPRVDGGRAFAYMSAAEASCRRPKLTAVAFQPR
jgi:hypothetical protein